MLRAQLNRLEEVTKDVADRIDSTADLVQSTVLRPVREVAAAAKGFGRGFDSCLEGTRTPNSSGPSSVGE